MSATILIDAAGRLVLPKSVRDSLSLTGGDALRVDVVAGRIELTPVEAGRGPELVRKRGMTVIARTGATVDAARAVAAERHSQGERGRRR